MLVLEESYGTFDVTLVTVYRCAYKNFTGSSPMSFYPAIYETSCDGVKGRATWEGFNRDVLKDPDQ